MVLQSPLNIQVLVSAVEKDAKVLAKQMKLKSPAVIINQCDKYDYMEWILNTDQMGDADKKHEQIMSCKIRCFSMPERGIGLSRNTALLHADADICLFSDEDIVFEGHYPKAIRKAYKEHPDADMILFNVKVAPERKTYWNDRVKRIHWYNYGRYPAYSISGRLDSLRKANVQFSLLFGGGAKYSNGEDSLFLRDCLKAGLVIYAVPDCIGEEIPRPSTWFSGYTEKFFTDRGVLYHYLYGKLARLFALRFLIKNKEEMCKEIPLKRAYKLMKAGIQHEKNF